jgi:Ca2+-binding RTX toxin-like protein
VTLGLLRRVERGTVMRVRVLSRIIALLLFASLGLVPAKAEVHEGTKACTITGTQGDDQLRGTSGRDVICGLGGQDILNGLGGDDIVRGGRGPDVVVGGSGDDSVSGGAGRDNLEGVGANRGKDRVSGGTGGDFIHDGYGEDRHRGGPGPDTVGFEPPRLDQRDLTLGGTGSGLCLGPGRVRWRRGTWRSRA